MMKVLRWAGIIFAIVFIGMQFIGPAKTNSTIDETRTIQTRTNMTPEVAAILERSCGDCHSNKTNWPWYSNVAPASWFVINHVNQGRRIMNFSDWARYDQRREKILLDRICAEVEDGGMPLESYTFIHHGAKLSKDDIQILCDWARQESRRIASPQPVAANP